MLWMGVMGLASCGLETSDLNAWISATSYGHGTVLVEAIFQRHDQRAGLVSLDDEDRIVATIGDQVKRVNPEFPGSPFYDAVFQEVGGGALEVVVEVDRQSESDASLSVVQIPDPFEIEPLTLRVSRASELTVTWSLSGTADEMGWWIETMEKVLLAKGSAVPDTGTLTIPAGQIDPNGTCDGDCELVFLIERRRILPIDPAFHGGQTTGKQLRVGVFHLVP
jgi:hypothetical protein